jgi:hypothetical protein
MRSALRRDLRVRPLHRLPDAVEWELLVLEEVQKLQLEQFELWE